MLYHAVWIKRQNDDQGKLTDPQMANLCVHRKRYLIFVNCHASATAVKILYRKKCDGGCFYFITARQQALKISKLRAFITVSRA